MAVRGGLQKATIKMVDLPPLSIIYDDFFVVTYKQIQTNVATLTLQAAHDLTVGEGIIVTGIDNVFDGYYIITAVTTYTISYARVHPAVINVAVSPHGSVARTSIGHRVRFRIASTDRNRFSHWSPNYIAKIPAFTVLGDVKISQTADLVTAVWGDAANRPKYDVFVRWGNPIDKASSVDYVRTLRTTTAAHGFAVGDVIQVSGINSNYDGIWKITDKTTNTISYTAPNIVNENNVSVSGTALQFVYSYHGTTSVHNYSFLRLPSFSLLHVDIQVESIDKIYNKDLLIYDSSTFSLT